MPESPFSRNSQTDENIVWLAPDSPVWVFSETGHPVKMVFEGGAEVKPETDSKELLLRKQQTILDTLNNYYEALNRGRNSNLTTKSILYIKGLFRQYAKDLLETRNQLLLDYKSLEQ